MQLGHVIYRIRDLSRTVADFETRSFTVEYGTVKRPCSALIYSSSGPYLELLTHTGMPPLLGRPLALGLRRGVTCRFLSWDRGPEGVCGLCLEGDVSELERERTLLSSKGLRLKPKRVDPYGRKLCYKVFFPDDVDLPLLMNHFDTDPRPRDFTHPNGIDSIAHVTYPMSEREQDTVLRLSDNNRFELVEP